LWTRRFIGPLEETASATLWLLALVEYSASVWALFADCQLDRWQIAVAIRAISNQLLCLRPLSGITSRFICPFEKPTLLIGGLRTSEKNSASVWPLLLNRSTHTRNATIAWWRLWDTFRNNLAARLRSCHRHTLWVEVKSTKTALIM